MVRYASRTSSPAAAVLMTAAAAVALTGTNDSLHVDAFRPSSTFSRGGDSASIRPPAVSTYADQIQKYRRGPSLAVSASTSVEDDSSDDNMQRMQSALSSAEGWAAAAAGAAADAATTAADAAANRMEEYVDEYELEQETLKARRDRAAREAASRRNQYEVTVPIVSSKSTSAVDASRVGLTLRQISAGGEISVEALDFDSLTLFGDLTTEEEMDPTIRDGSVEIITNVEHVSGNVGGNAKAGVVVSSVVRDGMAWEAGVRPGDMVLATSATVGQKMWPKTTLEGIRSAISSRRVMSSSIKLQLQRGSSTPAADTASGTTADSSTSLKAAVATDDAASTSTSTDSTTGITEFDLTLSRPLGINVEDGPDGYVLVASLNNTTTNPVNDFSMVNIGDRIVAVDSSLGSKMWPVSNVAGLVSACTSRLPGQTVSLRFERVVEEEQQQKEQQMQVTQAQVAAPSATSTDAAEPVPPPSSAAAATEGAKTRQALLSRCRDVLKKYTAQYKAEEIPPRALVTVADKIVAALADSSVSPDATTLNLLMNAYIIGNKADDAIRIFEASTGVSADGSNNPTGTVIASVSKVGYRIMPSLASLNLYTGTNLLRAHAMKRDGSSARRVLAAMEGREDVAVNGIRAASWPRGGEEAQADHDGNINDNWVTDTRCYNIVLAAASKMNTSSGLKIAAEVFESMADPKQSKEEWAASAAGMPFRDTVSYNSMISAYSRAGRIEDAMDMFRSMKSCGLKPDKFTYTSLIKSHVESGDVESGRSILDDMESNGVEADVFAYNTVIKGLCDKYRWYEAKELVTEMEWNGVRPDSYTYGMLMNGLIKAGKPETALTFFETACSDPRTVDIAQNVQIYTSAVTAASMMGDHARALGLVARMVSSGVQPNLKTFTSLMGGCLSSGKASYALDIFAKISEPDGYALELGIRAFCDSGDYASATSILTEQRDGRREMSGKQVMSSYDYIIASALQRRNFKVARDAVTELIESGYILSKKMFVTIPQALSLVPKRGEMRPQLTDENRAEAESAFDFMLFVLDIMEQRKLPIAGSFYAAILFEGSRSGGVRKKVASLIAESKLSMEGGTRIDVSDAVECVDGEERCIGWEDVLLNYVDYEGKGIALPPVRVKSDARSIRAILAAEQRVSFGRRRPRRAVV